MTCSSTHGMALYATDCSMEGGGVSQEAGLCGFPSSLLLLCRPEQSPWDFLCLLLFLWGVLYSTLLHLQPLRFHCADGCWHRPQDRCNWCIGSQTL
jgi:hypothetical protein